MPGKINYFNKEDFNRRGVFNQFYSECKINDSVFRKNDVFKKEEIKQVLNTCKKHNQLGFNTLIVRSSSDLTIWVEHKFQPSVKSDRQPVETAQKPSTTLPTKTVTKRYRGQVYEETVIDWAAVALQKQGTPEGKSRRKYRGNYID